MIFYYILFYFLYKNYLFPARTTYGLKCTVYVDFFPVLGSRRVILRDSRSFKNLPLYGPQVLCTDPLVVSKSVNITLHAFLFF